MERVGIRVNEILEFIAQKSEITREDLEKHFGCSNPMALSIIGNLATWFFIEKTGEHGKSETRSAILPTYRLSFLGEEKRKEELGVITIRLTRGPSLRPASKQLLSEIITRLNRKHSNFPELSEEEQNRLFEEELINTVEGYTSEELNKFREEYKKSREEFRKFFGLP